MVNWTQSRFLPRKIMCCILDFLLLTKPLPSFLLRNVARCSYVTLQGTELSILTSHSVFSKMCSKGNKPGIPPRSVLYIALCDRQQGVLYTFSCGRKYSCSVAWTKVRYFKDNFLNVFFFKLEVPQFLFSIFFSWFLFCFATACHVVQTGFWVLCSWAGCTSQVLGFGGIPTLCHCHSWWQPGEIMISQHTLFLRLSVQRSVYFR